MTNHLDVYKHYEILECTADSSHEDLKQAYKKMALVHHPDKHTTTSEEGYNTFLQVKEAWRILGDSELKKKYDAECRQAELECENILIHDRIRVMDMKVESDETLSYPCRCGSNYLIDQSELKDCDIIQIVCQECTFSLIIEKNK